MWRCLAYPASRNVCSFIPSENGLWSPGVRVRNRPLYRMKVLEVNQLFPFVVSSTERKTFLLRFLVHLVSANLLLEDEGRKTPGSHRSLVLEIPSVYIGVSRCLGKSFLLDGPEVSFLIHQSLFFPAPCSFSFLFSPAF